MARRCRKRRTRRKRAAERFATERQLILVAILATIMFAGWSWLAAHPEHDPAAPLDLRDPVGVATASKLASLRSDTAECRAVLERSGVAFAALERTGEGPCARPDRTRLNDASLSPGSPPVTCPVAVAFELWRVRTLEPAARELFGSELVRIEHLGAFSCRRLYGRNQGAWSEHATGNAIDIAAFLLEDGRRIDVLRDWGDEEPEAAFLRRARDGACDAFAVVLSPDYNAAHADHFHLDQGGRYNGVCR